MEKDYREEEHFVESADTDGEDASPTISMRELHSFSFSAMTGRENAIRGLQQFGGLDIVEGNRPSERPTLPREISEEEYQKLADEIKKTGKIPESLKKGFDDINGDRVFDIQRLNELLKDKNMKIEIRNYAESGPKLQLTQNGKVIDSYPGNRRREAERPDGRPPRENENGSPEPSGPVQGRPPEQGRPPRENENGSPEPSGPVQGRPPEQSRPPRENENGSPEPSGPAQGRPPEQSRPDDRIPDRPERPLEVGQEEDRMMWRLREALVGTWSGDTEKFEEAMANLQKMPREAQDRVLAALEKKLNEAGISLWVDRIQSAKEDGQETLNLTMNIPARPGMRDSGYIRVTLSSNGEHSGMMQHSLRDKPVKLDAATAQSYITEFANWQNMFGVYGPHVRPRK